MNPNIAEVAKVLSIDSVASILIAMLDGKFHTVTELAKAGNIKRNTASYHIKNLSKLKWVEEEQHGKHHYYRLCSADVAVIIEQLMRPAVVKDVKSFNEDIEQKILFNARTCYDHLAGKVGVELTNWFIQKKYIIVTQKEVQVTALGEDFFKNKLNLNISMLKEKKRKFAVMCLDWSERTHHLAGSLGNAVLLYLLNNKWIEHCGKTRGVKITKLGKEMFSTEWLAQDFLNKV
jgi:predicted transcriptional regulator